jgi:hypothetical protein
MAAVLVRHVGEAMTAVTAAPSTQAGPVALVDLLDRLLGTGVVLSGDVVISLADIELVQVQLLAVIQSVRAADSGSTAMEVPS